MYISGNTIEFFMAIDFKEAYHHPVSRRRGRRRRLRADGHGVQHPADAARLGQRRRSNIIPKPRPVLLFGLQRRVLESVKRGLVARVLPCAALPGYGAREVKAGVGRGTVW